MDIFTASTYTWLAFHGLNASIYQCLFTSCTSRSCLFEKETDTSWKCGFTYSCSGDVRMSAGLQHWASLLVLLHLGCYLTPIFLGHTWPGFVTLRGCQLSLVILVCFVNIPILWLCLITAVWVLVLLQCEKFPCLVIGYCCMSLPFTTFSMVLSWPYLPMGLLYSFNF